MDALQEKLSASPSAKSPARLFDEIRAALLDHFTRAESAPIGDILISNSLHRLYSTVLFLTVTTTKGTRRLVAKTTVHHPENKAVTQRENQAVVEFDVLRRLYPQFAQVEGCSVCRPILVIPKIETVIIEFVEGKLLSERLGNARRLSSRSEFIRLQNYFRLTGCWLRHFQDFTRSGDAGTAIVDGILKRCNFRLQLIEEAHDVRCPANLRKQVMSRLEEQVRLLGRERIPVAGRHGDFGPWNILCGPAGVTVLDFFGFQDEPLPVDPLQMLMALDREKASLTASPRRIDILEQAFVDGYGSRPELPAPLLLISETLHRVCTVQGCMSKRGGWLHKRIERNRCIRFNLAWLTTEKPAPRLWPCSKS